MQIGKKGAEFDALTAILLSSCLATFFSSSPSFKWAGFETALVGLEKESSIQNTIFLKRNVFKSIYLFTLGCTRSSLLCADFL